ncbi:MAG TPA: zinc dependent phospholipase C family protein [Bacteroidales bacterium]|nr:zinc dependent phospholipase C family protein [Bacteroidales bacterium]
MRKNPFRAAGRLERYALVLLAPFILSWGPAGHEPINRAAVLALPAPVQGFFYNHIDYITQESTVPDVRKYVLSDPWEKSRHFIDMENFGTYDDLPATLAEARKKYGDDFLQQNGILPWCVQEMMDKLTKAFKEKKKAEILFLAADLGHYIGDAHMPLHTSANYDGQLTNQKGIHAFFESQLPEMFLDTYHFNIKDAVYIQDVSKEVGRMVSATHLLVDTLLIAERDLNRQFPTDKVYLLDQTGKILKTKFYSSVHSEAYAQQYHQKLNGMVEKQLRLAMTATSNFWYTAWVNAGKPDLSDLDPVQQTERNKSNLKRELKLFKQGKLLDVKSEMEFQKLLQQTTH